MPQANKQAELTSSAHFQIVTDHLQVPRHFHFFWIFFEELGGRRIDIELYRRHCVRFKFDLQTKRNLLD